MTDLRDKADYITLTEAAEQSPYSQEYLSLRARQGKLRAVKRGRNWYTTPGWLDDYLQQVDVARSDLKAVEVVEEATPVSESVADTEPVSDPIAAIQPTLAVKAEEPKEPEEPFLYHPAATNIMSPNSIDRSAVVGSVLADEEKPKPTGKSFSWDEDEPKQIAPTPEHALLMANLQEKVDEAIAVDEPAIQLDESELSTVSATALGSGFVELGMNDELDEPEAADTVSYASTAASTAAIEDDRSDDKPADLNWLVKPALTTAVILLVVVSNFSMFDKLFQIRRNVGAGFGVVTYNAGQNLISLGKDRQERIEARKDTGSKIAIPAFQVDASELDTTNQSGTVAGATDTIEKRSFWATVAAGLEIVLDQFR